MNSSKMNLVREKTRSERKKSTDQQAKLVEKQDGFGIIISKTIENSQYFIKTNKLNNKLKQDMQEGMRNVES